MFAAFVTVALTAPAADPPKLSEAAEKELKKLQGKWKPEKIVANGNEETPPGGAEAFLEIKDRKFLLNEKEVGEFTALDPSTDPKCLDFKVLLGMGELTKGTVYEAIYKLDGDSLTLAVYVGAGNKRPAKFEAPKDSGTVLVTMKRGKK